MKRSTRQTQSNRRTTRPVVTITKVRKTTRSKDAVPCWADIQQYTVPIWNGLPGQPGSLPEAY